MPNYHYQCDDNHTTIQSRGMMESHPESILCDSCEKSATRVFGFSVSAFRAYTDHDISTTPVHFSSPGQRDAYLKEHSLTYDKFRYSKQFPKKAPSIADSLTNAELHRMCMEERATVESLEAEEKTLNALDDAGDLDGNTSYTNTDSGSTTDPGSVN